MMTVTPASRGGTGALDGRMSRKRARTLAQLLGSTRRVVALHGVAGTTIASITEDADVAFGTFYNYFNSKEEAVEEVTRQIVTELRAEVDAAVDAIPGPEVRIAAATTLVLLHGAYDAEWRAFVTEIGRSDPSVYRSLGLQLAGELDAGMRKGSFEVEDLGAVLAVFAGSVGASMEALRQGLLAPDSVPAVVEHLLRSIGVPAQSARLIARAARDLGSAHREGAA